MARGARTPARGAFGRNGMRNAKVRQRLERVRQHQQARLRRTQSRQAKRRAQQLRQGQRELANAFGPRQEARLKFWEDLGDLLQDLVTQLSSWYVGRSFKYELDRALESLQAQLNEGLAEDEWALVQITALAVNENVLEPTSPWHRTVLAMEVIDVGPPLPGTTEFALSALYTRLNGGQREHSAPPGRLQDMPENVVVRHGVDVSLLNDTYCGGKIPPAQLEALAADGTGSGAGFRRLWLETIRQHCEPGEQLLLGAPIDQALGPDWQLKAVREELAKPQPKGPTLSALSPHQATRGAVAAELEQRLGHRLHRVRLEESFRRLRRAEQQPEGALSQLVDIFQALFR